MAYENTYLAELTDLEAFESEQVTAQTAFNTVDAVDVPERAFSEFLFDDILVGGSSNVASLKNNGDQHLYVASTDTCAYTTFAADGLSERAVVGDPADVSYAGPSTERTISWDPTGRRPALLMLFNVELVRAFELGGGDPETNNLFLAWQVRQGGTWRTVRCTEQCYNLSRHITSLSDSIDADLPLHFLIDNGDLPVQDAEVTGVRVVLGIQSLSSSASVRLDRWNMDVLPLLAGAG